MDVNDPKLEWRDVCAKITGLWPKYQPTDAERGLIVQRLCKLNMRWLDAAVDEYRCQCTSTVFRLAELLEHYKRIANAGEPQARRKEATADPQRLAAEAAKVAREADAARAWLAKQPRATVASAVKWVRDHGWIGHDALPSDFGKWRDHHALMIRARIELDEEKGGR